MFRSLYQLSLPAFAFVVMASDAAGQASPFETGGIVGYVADSAGGRIAGAQLSILGVRGRAETGPDGTYRMSGVPSGSQILVARRIGFRPESVFVTVRQGIIADVAVHMRA